MSAPRHFPAKRCRRQSTTGLKDGLRHELKVRMDDGGGGVDPSSCSTLRSRLKCSSIPFGSCASGALPAHPDSIDARCRFNVAEHVKSGDGLAWVGFTSSTGAAFSTHRITSWKFQSLSQQGAVRTMGSNTYGQLGLTDTDHRCAGAGRGCLVLTRQCGAEPGQDAGGADYR